MPAGKVAEYFASLEKQGISINFGSYFSETQARTAVLEHFHKTMFLFDNQLPASRLWLG